MFLHSTKFSIIFLTLSIFCIIKRKDFSYQIQILILTTYKITIAKLCSKKNEILFFAELCTDCKYHYHMSLEWTHRGILVVVYTWRGVATPDGEGLTIGRLGSPNDGTGNKLLAPDRFSSGRRFMLYWLVCHSIFCKSKPFQLKFQIIPENIVFWNFFSEFPNGSFS